MKNEEQKELLKFLIVLGVVVIFVVGVYFITRIFVKEENKVTEETPAVGTVNYDVAIVGNMLKKPEKEYYVFVYDYESSNADMYKAMNALSNYLYSDKKDKLRIYNVELNNYFNKQFKVGEGEEENTKAQSVEEFKFGDFAVLRVKNGKVTKYLNTADAIEKEFKIK